MTTSLNQVSKRILIGAVCCMALFSLTAAEARIYATASNIQGGEIEILSWSWGETNEVRSAKGNDVLIGGLGDIVLVMPTGVPSVRFFEHFCNGTSPGDLSLFTIVGGGADSFAADQKYLKITFTDILVSSYQTAGSAGDVVPVDTISLNFEAIKFEYRELAGDGSVRFITESISMANPARQPEQK